MTTIHKFGKERQRGFEVHENCYGKETSSIGVTVSTMDGENYARFFCTSTSTSRQTGEKAQYDYKVQLVTTPCHLGGVRRAHMWFSSP